MSSADISPSTSGENVTEPTKSTMLRLTDVDTYYGPSQVLRKVSLDVEKGEIVCLLGANAAGFSQSRHGPVMPAATHAPVP